MAVNNVPANAFEELFASKREDLLKNLGDMNVPVERYDLYFSQLREFCQKISITEHRTISAKTGTEVLACMKELFTIEDLSNSLRPELRKKLREKFYLLEIPLGPPPAADGTNGPLHSVTSPIPAATQEAQRTADPAVLDEHINNTISLILHILLTISVRRGERFSSGDEIVWNDIEPLKKFVDSKFPAPKAAESEGEPKVAIDRTFTAANLWKKRGIVVEPTYDLRDHLLYAATTRSDSLKGSTEIRGTVQVYPLRRWLDIHQHSKKNLLSDNLIEETLESLALLFPFWQSHSNEEYLKLINFEKMIDCELPSKRLATEINLNDFKIWHDRLEEIYGVFTGPPISERQKFREDKQGFFTFWGAVVAIVAMTFIFGVLAITFAILAWSKAHADADELLEAVKELLEVVKKAAEISGVVAVERAPTVTVTVTAVRF